MTDSEIGALLREPQVAVLATADRRGRPDATPVWYEWDGSRVRILVHRDSLKARNIRANPHVAVTVDTRVPPYRGVVLRGIATLGGADPALRRRLAKRYLGEDVGERYIERTLSLDEEDALVTVKVVSRYSWDYSKGV